MTGVRAYSTGLRRPPSFSNHEFIRIGVRVCVCACGRAHACVLVRLQGYMRVHAWRCRAGSGFKLAGLGRALGLLSVIVCVRVRACVCVCVRG